MEPANVEVRSKSRRSSCFRKVDKQCRVHFEHGIPRDGSNGNVFNYWRVREEKRANEKKKKEKEKGKEKEKEMKDSSRREGI